MRVITADVKKSIDRLESEIKVAKKSGKKVIGVSISHVVFVGLIEERQVSNDSIPVNVDTGDMHLNQVMDAMFGDGTFSYAVVTSGGEEYPLIVTDALEDTGDNSFRLVCV